MTTDLVINEATNGLVITEDDSDPNWPFITLDGSAIPADFSYVAPTSGRAEWLAAPFGDDGSYNINGNPTTVFDGSRAFFVGPGDHVQGRLYDNTWGTYDPITHEWTPHLDTSLQSEFDFIAGDHRVGGGGGGDGGGGGGTSLTLGQMVFNGFLFGDGTNWGDIKVVGLGPKTPRMETVPRAGVDGSWVFGAHAEERHITISGIYSREDGDAQNAMLEMLDTFASAFEPLAEPAYLEWNWPSWGHKRIACLPIRCDFNADRLLSVGYCEWAVELVAPDPAIENLDE